MIENAIYVYKMYEDNSNTLLAIFTYPRDAELFIRSLVETADKEFPRHYLAFNSFNGKLIVEGIGND